MVRYYSNVVGRYGQPVQKALAKLKNLPVSMICSTHGPVWVQEKDRVISLYDRWSRYEAERGVTLAYGSMYGNTERMAETIAEELSQRGIRKIRLHNLSKSDPSYILADVFRYRGLILGAPTYNATLFPAMESLLSKILNRDIKGRYLGYFGSFSWAGAAVLGPRSTSGTTWTGAGSGWVWAWTRPLALASISLMRFSWLILVAPGS